MSSQSSAGVTGYSYPTSRDAQDWTRKLKEQRLYTSYSTPGGDSNTDMSPPWMKFGNDVRLTFNQGRFSCSAGTTGCEGNAFKGVIPLGDVPSGPKNLLSYLNYGMYNAKLDHGATPVIADPGTWGIYDDTLLLELLTSDIGDDNGSPCTRSNPNTIVPRKVDDKWDYFNLYITGYYTAPVSGSYTFTFESDDGITMVLDGNTLIENTGYSIGGGTTSSIVLTAGVKYPLQMLWTNGTGGLNLCVTLIEVDGTTQIQDTYPFTLSCSPT